jgi:hypothetical protein
MMHGGLVDMQVGVSSLSNWPQHDPGNRNAR